MQPASIRLRVSFYIYLHYLTYLFALWTFATLCIITFINDLSQWLLLPIAVGLVGAGYFPIRKLVKLPRLYVTRDGVQIDKRCYGWSEIKEIEVNICRLPKHIFGKAPFGMCISLIEGTEQFFLEENYRSFYKVQDLIAGIATANNIMVIDNFADEDDSDEE